MRGRLGSSLYPYRDHLSKRVGQPGMKAYTCNSSIPEGKAGELWVQDQLELYSKAGCYRMKGWGCISEGEGLPSRHKTLDSIPSPGLKTRWGCPCLRVDARWEWPEQNGKWEVSGLYCYPESVSNCNTEVNKSWTKREEEEGVCSPGLSSLLMTLSAAGSSLTFMLGKQEAAERPPRREREREEAAAPRLWVTFVQYLSAFSPPPEWRLPFY